MANATVNVKSIAHPAVKAVGSNVNLNHKPPLAAPLLGGKQKAAYDRKVTEFIAENFQRLRGFIFRYVKDPQIAEDLVQQTLLITYRNFDAFRGESARSTWFLGIARNLIRNHFSRTPDYNYSFVDPEVLTNSKSDDRTPEENVVAKETMSHILDEIDKLPSKLKQVVEMVVLSENSYKEVSDKLQVSIGTVRSRLSRARNRLRSEMENDALVAAAKPAASKAKWSREQPLAD